MAIVFAPIRQCRKKVSGPDMMVRLRRYNNNISLEIQLSAATQEKVRYVDGDRVLSEYDPDNKSWTLERISPDRYRDGYKVSVRALKDNAEYVTFRVGCRDASSANAVLGARDEAAYDFLEVTGNKSVFVEKE